MFWGDVPSTISGWSTKYLLMAKPAPSVFAKLHPVRLNVRRAVTFCKKIDVALTNTAVLTDGMDYRQTDGTQQIGTLCHVLAGGAVLAVHGVAVGGPTPPRRPGCILDSLGEVVVDGDPNLLYRLVVDLEVA